MDQAESAELELHVLKTCAVQLELLTPVERERVIWYLIDKYVCHEAAETFLKAVRKQGA